MSGRRYFGVFLLWLVLYVVFATSSEFNLHSQDPDEIDDYEELIEMHIFDDYHDDESVFHDEATTAVKFTSDVEEVLSLKSTKQRDSQRINEPKSTLGSRTKRLGRQPSQSRAAETASVHDPSVKTQRAASKTTMMDASINIPPNLYASVVNKLSAAETRLQDEEEAQRHLQDALRIPRKYARPVENILAYCGTGNPSNWRKICGLTDSESLDEIKLKKAFRAVSLSVHPDKNPHPEAKNAFDCVRDSYAALSESLQSSNRIDSFSTMQQNSRKSIREMISFRKFFLKLYYSLDNVHARVMLLLFRIRKGLWKQELQAMMVNPFALVIKSFKRFYQRIAYAPTAVDRMSIVGELFIDHKYKVCAAVAAAICLYCF